MMPSPIALGMTLCDSIILEEGTKKVSQIGSFTGLRVTSFPTVPLPFSVYVPLTGGFGEGTLELTITLLEDDDEVYSLTRSVRFPDRFMEVRVLFRLSECEFPSPGVYLFTLMVDGDWVAHRRLRVYSSEAL